MSDPEPRDYSGSPAEVWERYMVPGVFAPWARRLLDEVRIRPGDRVLDVACATGTVARLTAQRLAGTGHVTGVDLNEEWLEVARKASAKEASRIEWRCGNASSLPLPSDSFDVVLCQQGIQFFDEREAALHEMHRVLAGDGRFAASVFRSIDRSPGYRSLATALGRHLGPESEARAREIFSLGDPDVLRSWMRSAGFQQVEIRPAVEKVHFQSVEDFPRVYAVLCETTPAVTKALIRDVSRDLQDWCDAKGLTFPMEALVATGAK